MTVVAHYHSIELATGIAISETIGTIGAIANRIYAVELVDVSNPEQPGTFLQY